MSYQQNDPNRNLNRPIDPADRRFAAHERWGIGSVILAALAALAVVFGLFYTMSNRSNTSVARTDRSVATSPATTGSGATNRDTTTKPAIPTPASSVPPATNH